jgi:hypothetical protein
MRAPEGRLGECEHCESWQKLEDAVQMFVASTGGFGSKDAAKRALLSGVVAGVVCWRRNGFDMASNHLGRELLLRSFGLMRVARVVNYFE